MINRDILFDLGGGDIDGFIANPDDQYKPEYSQLKDLREYFFKRYNGAFNYSLFIRTISRFDKSLFRQIKKMLPARAKSNVGFYIESHILERNKQKVANKPIPEELFYEQKIDVSSEGTGIIETSGENRTHTGSFDATLITDLNGEKRNYLGTFDTTLVTDLLGEQRNYIGYITSSKTDYDTDGNFIQDNFRNRFQQSAQYNRTILVTSQSGQVGQGEFNDQFITTTFRPDQREPLGSVITGSRLSVLFEKKNLFYSSSLSASLDQQLGHLNNHFFAYSQSLEKAEYQDYKPGQDRAFFIGTKNTDDTTIDGGPVVEIKTTNPRKLKVKKPGFKGGNLKVK